MFTSWRVKYADLEAVSDTIALSVIYRDLEIAILRGRWMDVKYFKNTYLRYLTGLIGVVIHSISLGWNTLNKIRKMSMLKIDLSA